MRPATRFLLSFMVGALLIPKIVAAVPTVVTMDIYDVTSTSAACGGTVVSDGGSTVTTRGACWSTLPNPTVADNRTNDGSGTGTYSSSLTGLGSGTIYYVRAYATSAEGTAYGIQKAFTTLTILPTVTTAAVTSITATTAASGGNAITDGGATITVKGVCWSTLPNPTLGTSLTTDGSGLGGFASLITGLTPGTTYHVRAYATNIAGTGYGDDVSFSTPSTPTVITASVDSVTDTTATCGGNVTADGGAAVTVRGVCWATSENPTTANSKTENASGTGVFTSLITALSAGTTYYVRAYATNSAGTSYGEQRSFQTSTPFAKLTMMASGSGSTIPTAGEHTVATLKPFTITATAAEQYHFTDWTASGGVQITDPNSSTTTATLTGEATITANFTHDTAALSLTTIPTDYGTTTPTPGTHTVNTFEAISITAAPFGGNYFTGWYATGNATIANASSATTTITLAGDAIVAANFSALPPDTAAMSMTVYPTEGGTATPEGVTVVSINVPQTINAAANAGFYFAGWTVFPTTNAIIANSSLTSTTITIAGDVTVTANFLASPPSSATLTMAVTPESSGATTPAGSISIFTNIPQSVMATPAEGYFFVKWTATENATITVPTSSTTTVVLTNNAVVTAEFSTDQTLYLAVGSVVTVNASDLGDPIFLEFKKTPKIYTAQTNAQAVQMKPANSASTQKPTKQITAAWVKKILLYVKKNFKGVKISEALLKTPMTNLALGDLFAQTKEVASNVPINLGKKPWLAVPVITDVSNSGGVIMVKGQYFGSTAPKVLVEYNVDGGTWRYKSCAVDKTATYIFKDAKGYANKSCMKVLEGDLGGQAVGYSQVMVTYPTLPKGATLSGYIILDNSVAMTTVKLP